MRAPGSDYSYEKSVVPRQRSLTVRDGRGAHCHTDCATTGVLRGRIGARPPHSLTGLPASRYCGRRKVEVHDYQRFGRRTYGSAARRLRLVFPAPAESPLAPAGRGYSFTLRISTPFPWSEIQCLGLQSYSCLLCMSREKHYRLYP